MNIFAVDASPERAARMLCDAHVVKMPLEAAQLLSNAFPPETAPYRRTHHNHPCSKWVRASRGNFLWLVRHGLALCDEYTKRYGREHASASAVRECAARISEVCFPRLRRTPFVQVMPEEYKGSDAVEAYRRYYVAQKSRICRWNRGRTPPRWFIRN